jgi:hypothetical protein
VHHYYQDYLVADLHFEDRHYHYYCHHHHYID